MKSKALTIILAIFSLSLLSGSKPDFPKDYNKKWEKVDSLINQGLPQSAMSIVEEIYNKAKQEKNTQQFIKAVIYKMRLLSDFEEDFLVKVIDDLNNEIKSSDTPEKQILHSILAEVYWGYYQKNRYKFLERTTTSNVSDDDIQTWDLNKILEKTIQNYEASLENPEALKKLKLKDFDLILNTKENSKTYRPTLYDFLAQRAIDFYMNDESGLTQPAYKFEINKTNYYDDAQKFIKLDISTKDTLSLKYHAMLIMQDLIAFHLGDKDPMALIDIDLKRLSFVYNNSVMIPEKDSIYLVALQNLADKYSDSPGSADVSYEMAQLYLSLGQQYNPLVSDKYKYEKKKAYEVCENAIERFPKSKGGMNCKTILNQIERIIIDLNMESVVVPESPILGLLSYQNAKEVYFKIVPLQYEKDRKLRRNYDNQELIEKYLKKKVIKEWSVEVPDDVDFQKHAAQIKLPELPKGYYVVLAASNPLFDTDNTTVAYTHFAVSSISYINRRANNGDQEFYVLDRISGNPIEGVHATLFEEKYDYNKRKYNYKEIGSFESDKNGYLNFPFAKLNRSTFTVRFVNEDDTLWSDGVFSTYYYDRGTLLLTKTFFFTDRAIYRPGQTIYFKGIILNEDGDDYKIVTEEKTTVTFYDVNSQKITSINLVSNEYGSFNGSFTAPTGLLNGIMRIENESGTQYISVEDYKRPKFEVLFDPVKGSYKLNENVEVIGKAKAYAGNPIDGAKVKYRVVRETRFPYWGYWYRGFFPSSPDMEITNGETITNEKGEFTIDFLALPDANIPRKNNPVFNYKVYADVTDINGETHSNETMIAVGYNALLIDMNFPDKVNADTENEFSIKSTNLNGEPEAADIKFKIYKLKHPDRIFRERLWRQPDVFLMDKEEFVKIFPNDIYKDEDNPANWEKEKNYFSDEINTEKTTKLNLDNIKDWPEGMYIVEAETVDKYGKKVEAQKYFQVFSPEAKHIPINEANWITALKAKGEPGEEASILFGSAEKINVLYEIVLQGKIISREWLDVKNKQMQFDIPIIEKYRGNFGVNLIFIKNNRAYQNTQQITVPFTNKMLDIEFATFRDKLKPGQKEEWQIKISGKNGEKVTAEMLASMYDASLDVFRKNYWSLNLYPSNYISSLWSHSRAFSVESSRYYEDYNWLSPVYQNYDELNWFGFNFYGYYNVLGMGRVADEMAAPTAMRETKQAEAGDPGEVYEEESDGYVKGEDIPDTPDDGKEETVEAEKQPVKIRSDFRETAFFYPDLKTNEKGELIFSFTMPEALTRWKMMGLAYTKDLKVGQVQKELVTQKDLMVVPNQPRFFREGDSFIFTSKIVSLADKALSGEVELQFFDALTMKSVDQKLQLKNGVKKFEVEKGQSASVSWQIEIPEGLEAITYRIVAKAGNFSDGEEMAIPVLPNRMLVTESLPLPIRGEETKNFKFEKLLKSAQDKTLSNYQLSLEYTSNPAWYAVQALPYLMEYPFECSEQVFSRYYANSLATHIANSSPKIKRVFESWRDLSPDALLSNLEKNQDLKSVLLEETPWVRQAKSESERKKRIALLFDLNKMSYELENALLKLQQMQTSNGGWPWFPGMRDSRYITQHIVTGLGHLINLNVGDLKNDQKTWAMIKDAVRYLDNRIREDYEYLKKHFPKKMNDDHLGHTAIQYLYARSYFIDDINVSKYNQKAFQYFRDQADKYWVEKNIYMQGMISLALNRFGYKTTPSDIIKSLKEKSLHSEEMGMYWRSHHGWYWYQAPIERQALLIEAFDEVANDEKSVEEMKIWLLKQKQTQNWETTKATVEAVYALILRGMDLLESDELVEITLGSLKVDPKNDDEVDVEAGTGYFRKNWTGTEIKPEMGDITVTKNDKGIAWGALYWQYFQDLDKITPHETPLSLERKLYVERNTDSGPVIEAVDGKTLEIGDKIIVRIIVRTDRDMEYIHLKDMRASALEPVETISRYQYKDGLGYYQTTRDASMNFFMDYLPKGTYVLEYPLIVSQKGSFSNGISNIQCMYAPEFTSHSEGVRLNVE